VALTEEQRAAAARLRELYKLKPTKEQRDARRRRRIRTVVIAGVAVLVLAAAGFGALALANRPAESVAVPTASPTRTPTPTETVGPPEFVLVEGDFVANPPAQPLGIGLRGDVIFATGLGQRGGFSAVGFATDADEVCIMLYYEGGGTGDCTDYAGAEAGLVVDRGSWSITWWPDGRVEWVGI